jgi:hypothetical protein
MSDQDQRQPIDPSKMIGGRRAMTQSHRKEKERKNAHILKRERGRRGGWFRDFSGFSGYTTSTVTCCWPVPGGVPELSGSGTPRCHWWWVWPEVYTRAAAYTRPGWHFSWAQRCYLWSLPFLEDRKIYLCCTLMPTMCGIATLV